MWAPPSVGLAEEKRGELEVGGVALPPAQTVGSLIVDTRPMCGLKVDVVQEVDCPQLVGNRREVAARTAVVVHVGDRRAVVGLE